METFQPFYIEGSKGKLFALYYPAREKACSGAILYVPPFAEEMNKTRPSAAIQARELAKCGFAVLQVDLFGTGDSEGEFKDATLEGWHQDIALSLDWLAKINPPAFYFWGARFGCLLAVSSLDYLRHSIAGALFWEPMSSGSELVREMERLNRISVLVGKGGDKSCVPQDIRDIAGYQMHNSLLEDINALTLNEQVFEQVISVKVLEDITGNGGGTEKTEIGEDQPERLKVAVMDKRFWLNQDITICREVIEQSTKAVLKHFRS